MSKSILQEVVLKEVAIINNCNDAYVDDYLLALFILHCALLYREKSLNYSVITGRTGFIYIMSACIAF